MYGEGHIPRCSQTKRYPQGSSHKAPQGNHIFVTIQCIDKNFGDSAKAPILNYAAGIFITSCMNFLHTGRISLLRVALNIITCFSCGVKRNISCTSRRISATYHQTLNYFQNKTALEKTLKYVLDSTQNETYLSNTNYIKNNKSVSRVDCRACLQKAIAIGSNVELLDSCQHCSVRYYHVHVLTCI